MNAIGVNSKAAFLDLVIGGMGKALQGRGMPCD